MGMKKLSLILVVLITVSIVFTGCEKEKEIKKESTAKEVEEKLEEVANEDEKDVKEEKKEKIEIDYNVVKPDESGKIMVVMFHNFVETAENGDYTTTFDAFEKLLKKLNDMKYTLISMNDFIDNNIDVPPGRIPMVFTFDDATNGQFHLVEKGGKLVAGERTAVAIMEKFYEENPEFGLNATFYCNLGVSTFEGEGTLAERLKYLVDKGFEIGNHTMTHINLKDTTEVDTIVKEVGGTLKAMSDLIPDYKIKTFSLPFGAPAGELVDYVIKGEYEGVKYEHFALLEVGWDPSLNPINLKFDPMKIHRVRSNGIKPVQADLDWWLEQGYHEYISDGDPDKISVPTDKQEKIDETKLNDKELVVY